MILKEIIKKLTNEKSEDRFTNEEFSKDFFDIINLDIERLKSIKRKEKLELNSDLESYKKFLFDKYSQEYCPAPLFKYFNESNKIQYMFLRVEIDRLLKINNTKYII